MRLKACCGGHPIIPYTHPLDEPGNYARGGAWCQLGNIGANDWINCVLGLGADVTSECRGSTRDSEIDLSKINLNKTMETPTKNETTEISGFRGNGTSLDSSNTSKNITSDSDRLLPCSTSTPFYIHGSANSCSMPVRGNNSAIMQQCCGDNPITPYSSNSDNHADHLGEGYYCSLGGDKTIHD